MADSIRQQLITTVLDRLTAIRADAGFTTNAGARVYLGESPDLGPADPVDAIALVILETSPVRMGGFVQEPFEFEVQALTRADVTNPYLSAEVLLTDVVRAIEQPDRTLGSLLKIDLMVDQVRMLPRQPGATTVGCAVRYSGAYVRKWGEP